jgi:hypothetical protein
MNNMDAYRAAFEKLIRRAFSSDKQSLNLSTANLQEEEKNTFIKIITADEEDIEAEEEY